MAALRELSDEQRRALAGLQANMRAELLDIWDKLNTNDIARLTAALDDILLALYTEYGDAHGTLAAEFYDELRGAAGASGRFTPTIAVLSDEAALGRFSTITGVSVGPLFGANPDRASAFTLLSGGLQEAVMNVHRDTIMGASVSDSASRGWQRVGQGDNCPFCNMLIGRGDVYKKSTVKFGAHAHCNCKAVPTFEGTPNYYKASEVAAYRKTARRIRPADRARVKAWIAANA